MAVTAEQKLSNAVIVDKLVKAASTATIGCAGKFDAGDELTVLDCTAGDNPDVIFLETGVAGKMVSCLLLGGNTAVVPVKVGAAATAGSYAEVGTNGTLTNRTLGGGTTVRYLAGKFTQTGVTGDMVGLAVGPFAGVSA